MIRAAIILAGGLGTRLRSAVPDLPKCMAPVAGEPFIHHVVKHLLANNISRVVMSLGYMHDVIADYMQKTFPDLEMELVIEKEPLGTGGAVMLASRSCTESDVIVANGDTLFKADIRKLAAFHKKQEAECTLTLKPMRNFDRYGVVVTDKGGYINTFLEKAYYDEGLINGGLYALHLESFLQIPFPEKFSFETDYLERYYPSRRMMGLVQDEYFIDIGIPEDFKKADAELRVSS